MSNLNIINKLQYNNILKLIYAKRLVCQLISLSFILLFIQSNVFADVGYSPPDLLKIPYNNFSFTTTALLFAREAIRRIFWAG